MSHRTLFAVLLAMSLHVVPSPQAVTEARAQLAVAKVVVIKVGSSVLVGEEGSQLDRMVFAPLVADIARLIRAGRRVVLVSSGAVAVGRRATGSDTGPLRLAQKQALAAIGQPRLMQFYADEFAFYDLHVAQVLLTRADLADRERFLNARRTVRALFDRGDVVPIVNENDTVATAELRFGDNDRLAALVSHAVDASALVILSDVDALYTADPREVPDATPIEAAFGDDEHLSSLASEPQEGALGTGGMASKLRAAQVACARGIPTVIASGRRAGVVTEALSGPGNGTLLLPGQSSLSSRKAWIAHGAAASGTIHVDAGARRALVERDSSLLPAGIVSVDGEFTVGAMVRLCLEGMIVGHGLASQSASRLRLVAGQGSRAIDSKHGSARGGVAVHRDDLVLHETEAHAETQKEPT
ncbi:MAG: glutamate 5-kinase [Bradymonadia bacterium]|jgi:glutamate 5-kinase